MVDRTTAGYIFAALIIVVAVIGGYFGFLSEQTIVGLVILALVVAGLGKMRDGNFEVALHRLMRLARAYQPAVVVDHKSKKVRVYTFGGQFTASMASLMSKIARKFGYEVSLLGHGGFVLVQDKGWEKVAENPDLHGPEYSGATDEVPTKNGPKFIKVVLRHVKYLEARRFVGLRLANGGLFLSYDGVIGKNETQEFYFVTPTHYWDWEPITDDFVVIISNIAFRDTPSVLAYEVYQQDVELPKGGAFIAYVKPTNSGVMWTWPDKLYIEEVGTYRVKNLSEYPVMLYVDYVWKFKALQFFARLLGLRRARPLASTVLEPGGEAEFTVDEYDLKWPVSVSVSPRVDGSYGYVQVRKVVTEEKPPEQPSETVIYVQSGDEIRPDAEPWVGSAGHGEDGYILTNAHVCPEVGVTVYLTKERKKLGVVEKVADIKTVTALDVFLNWLLGIKLPTNKVDVAKIRAEPNVQYKPFDVSSGDPYPSVVHDAEVGEVVYSRGRTSGYRKGTVKETSVTVMVPWPHKNNQPAIFEDVIMLEMETRPGDSGSAVANEKGWIGLIFAGDTSYSIGLAIKASNIAKWLG